MGSMARQVTLFLIRHGETVDNIARVFAGSRDSELTNHGHQQAARLGLHFRSQGVTFSHMFSSHLQRAATTAAKIREAQVAGAGGQVPAVVHLPLLVEQDFGFYEGKKWHERPPSSNSTRRPEHMDTPGFVDVESNESMAHRVDAFLDNHLLPLLDGPTEPEDLAVAVVSHGITLSVLWRRLLRRLPPKSVEFSPSLLADTNGYSLERLGGWSNTGYLELHLQKAAVREPSPASAPTPPELAADPARVDTGAQDTVHTLPTAVEPTKLASFEAALPSAQPIPSAAAPKLAHGWRTTIKTVNGRAHLAGLKRTRGGVGSAPHDATQKNIESFFKKRRVE